MRAIKVIFLLSLVCMVSGCGVMFLTKTTSQDLDKQVDYSLKAAQQADDGVLADDLYGEALAENATYFANLKKQTGWFRPVFMSAKYTQLLARITLTSDEALSRYVNGVLSKDDQKSILGHQAVNLMLFQDARDGRADVNSDAYLTRLWNRIYQPTTTQPAK